MCGFSHLALPSRLIHAPWRTAIHAPTHLQPTYAQLLLRPAAVLSAANFAVWYLESAATCSHPLLKTDTGTQQLSNIVSNVSNLTLLAPIPFTLCCAVELEEQSTQSQCLALVKWLQVSPEVLPARMSRSCVPGSSSGRVHCDIASLPACKGWMWWSHLPPTTARRPCLVAIRASARPPASLSAAWLLLGCHGAAAAVGAPLVEGVPCKTVPLPACAQALALLVRCG